MDYFEPNGAAISVFDVCHAYQMLEANYNVGGWLRERPSNQRRRESIGCQLARLRYDSGHRDVDLWLDGDELSDELESHSDDENVRYVYFKKALEWGLPLYDDDRRVIDRIFTIDAIERWRPDYYLMRPWRPVARTDSKWTFDQPMWLVGLPRDDGITIFHCNEEGKPTYFHSYAAATQKAKSLTEEMHASTQGSSGAQGAQSPGS